MRPSAVSLRERDGRRSNQGWGLVGSQASGEELPFPGAGYQTTPISKHGKVSRATGPSRRVSLRDAQTWCARPAADTSAAAHTSAIARILEWVGYIPFPSRSVASPPAPPSPVSLSLSEGVLSSSGRSRSAALSSIHSSRGAASPRCSFLAVSPSPSPLSLSRACSLSLAALAQLPSPRYTRRVEPLRRAAPFSR